jgi:hypothetical protein
LTLNDLALPPFLMGKKSPGGAFCEVNAVSKLVGAQKAWFLRARVVDGRGLRAPNQLYLEP